MMHAVIEAQGETTPANAQTRSGDFNDRRWIQQSLRRYPRTADDETAGIPHFPAEGNHLDVGLAGGSDGFREKGTRFRKEHSRHLRPKPHDAGLFRGHSPANLRALLAVALVPGALSIGGFGRPGAACFTSNGGC